MLEKGKEIGESGENCRSLVVEENIIGEENGDDEEEKRM